MYKINEKMAERMEPVTFKSLGMSEYDIEELLRNSIDMICDEEESMLIVGKQVTNNENARSDLTAVDNNGDIVLIEIKRDLSDITNRKEPFEFQAIRYAASYATIDTPDDLVKKIYAPYIEKFRNEFEHEELTSFELGVRKLNEFLKTNEAIKDFNEYQRIILVASDFDEQTLSAVAWLSKNNVDISCYKLIPYKFNDAIYLRTEKLLPVTLDEDYYVGFNDGLTNNKSVKSKGKRRNLPKIDSMLDWGVIEAGDILLPKGRKGQAELLANGNVIVNEEEQSIQAWLKKVYGWSSVQTYAFTIHEKTNKTLSEIRKEYMKKNSVNKVEYSN